MPRYEMSAQQAALLLLNIQDCYRRAAIREQAQTIVEAKRELILQSSGTITTKELAKMGHPFSRRAPQTPIDSRVINDQGGPFKTSWQIGYPKATADGVTSFVVNLSKESRFMHGTPSMIHRGIISAVEEHLMPVRRRRMANYYAREVSAEAKRIMAMRLSPLH